jgi:very-short-patch-repair endonuclease
MHEEIIQMSNDETREYYLNSLGIKVIRFSNKELFIDEERVIVELKESIEKRRKEII